VLHTSSGGKGGTVTIVVIGVPDGLLVEVIDGGSSASGPEVSGDRYAAHGHGLFPGRSAGGTLGMPSGHRRDDRLVPDRRRDDPLRAE